MPTLFLSLGAPHLVVDHDNPAHGFLCQVSASWVKPTAIIVCSAHWMAREPTVESGEHPATLHDFQGFPPALYALRYGAAGSPELAARIKGLLKAAGFAPESQARGYDHGVWVPLSLMYPRADIPVVAVSLLAHGGPAAHLRMGAALASLREEGVLIIGSGGATHNLGALRMGGGPAAPWAQAFDDWLVEHVVAGDQAALIDYRRQAPDAARNHPTEEHLLPLFVALGAAGPGARGSVLYRSMDYASLSMTAFAFP